MKYSAYPTATAESYEPQKKRVASAKVLLVTYKHLYVAKRGTLYVAVGLLRSVS